MLNLTAILTCVMYNKDMMKFFAHEGTKHCLSIELYSGL